MTQPYAVPVFDPATHVPELLPPVAASPEPARRVGWLKGLLLFWLLPGRYGPHLAAGSLTPAVAAHLVAIFIALALVGLALAFKSGHPVRGLEDLRILAAHVVLDAAVASATTGVSWLAALLMLGAIPLIQLPILALAVGAMPWSAGGDAPRSVWRRSVRNTYWSSTVLIPTGLVMFGVLLLIASPPEPPPSPFPRTPDWPTIEDPTPIVLTLLIFTALFLRCLLTGASRYVGPPVGPAFEPFAPRCDDCGYLLIHLPLEGRCPECGTPIADSLPGGRRQPTGWHRHEHRARGLPEHLRLQWTVIRDPNFFRRLPVHTGAPAARHFWWTTFLCLTLAPLTVHAGLFAALYESIFDAPVHNGLPWPAAVPVLLVLPLAFQAQALLYLCLRGHWRFGLRNYQVPFIAGCFAAPLMWPLLLSFHAAVLVLVEPFHSRLNNMKLLAFAQPIFDGSEIVLLLVILPLLLILGLFWMVRLHRILRSIRFANA
jgi:hypothetical protein